MSREELAVTTDGEENTHPAWALIGANRVSSSPPGATLFASDIRHQHSVIIHITQASRRRNLLRDWLHGRRQLIEVQLSEAQWASFVSSMNSGQGVPCTLLHVQGEQIPGVPFEPRLKQSMDEVRNAADKAFEHIKEAFDAYAEKKNAGNLRTLKYAIANATANVVFAGDSLTEHAEEVVEKSRADIEAMIVSYAERAGVDPKDALTMVGSDERPKLRLPRAKK